MGQQWDQRSRSAANATTAKNTAGYCRRQQSGWRIFSVIFSAIGSAALPGSAVPAPPRHCPPESRGRASHLPPGAAPAAAVPQFPSCSLRYGAAPHPAAVTQLPPPHKWPRGATLIPCMSTVSPAPNKCPGTRGLQGSHLRPGSSSPAQAAGGEGQRPDAMSWPSVTRRPVTVPPPCRHTSPPPPPLIPAGKAKRGC